MPGRQGGSDRQRCFNNGGNGCVCLCLFSLCLLLTHQLGWLKDRRRLQLQTCQAASQAVCALIQQPLEGTRPGPAISYQNLRWWSEGFIDPLKELFHEEVTNEAFWLLLQCHLQVDIRAVQIQYRYHISRLISAKKQMSDYVWLHLWYKHNKSSPLFHSRTSVLYGGVTLDSWLFRSSFFRVS